MQTTRLKTTTFGNKSKTHSGMLPQCRTLEVSVDVTGKVKPVVIDTGATPRLVSNLVEGSAIGPSAYGRHPRKRCRGVSRKHEAAPGSSQALTSNTNHPRPTAKAMGFSPSL